MLVTRRDMIYDIKPQILTPARKMLPLVFIFLGWVAPATLSPWDSLTANIAVVEYRPLHDSSALNNNTVALNTKKYVEILKSASPKKLDLIVFPEAGLRDTPETAVEVRVSDNPCKSASQPDVLTNLSCAAAASKTYMVVNLVEKSKCDIANAGDNCAKFGFRFYNTDVVFDRSGTIVNRYRKYNLFGERDLDKPDEPEEVVIETDFGVRFGIFTCFDVLFKRPAQDLLRKNVDGVIFPTMWHSELPFLTALQTQQMWAHAHDTYFFGAGTNVPIVGSGGTGVYRGSRSRIFGSFLAEDTFQTFIFESVGGKVPPPPPEDVDLLAEQMSNFTIFTDTSLPRFASFVVDTAVKNIQKRLCHGEDDEDEFCCDFDLRLSLSESRSDLPFYSYLLVVFSGVRSFRGMYNGGIQTCGVVACLNSSLSSCGHRFARYEEVQWPVTFEEITIQMRYEEGENKTFFPNSLLSSIRPIDASDTYWTGERVGEKSVKRTFSVKKPQNRLFTFAIYGRNFDKDSPAGSGKGSSRILTWLLLSCVVFLSGFSIMQ
jgi:predicted amidohydrolase